MLWSQCYEKLCAACCNIIKWFNGEITTIFPRPLRGNYIDKTTILLLDGAKRGACLLVCLLACLVCLFVGCAALSSDAAAATSAETAPVRRKDERVHEPEGINPSLYRDCVFICPPLK